MNAEPLTGKHAAVRVGVAHTRLSTFREVCYRFDHPFDEVAFRDVSELYGKTLRGLSLTVAREAIAESDAICNAERGAVDYLIALGYCARTGGRLDV